MSASLYKAKISNMNKCLNLKNLYSYGNTYINKDIQYLCNLKRLYSYKDTYQDSNICLLGGILQNNMLEYIYIFNENDITSPITLS